MTAADNLGMNWERISAELRAYRDAQRQRWGDVDDMTIAAYLAGTCSPAERDAIQSAMGEYPAVRELVEGLQTMFAESAQARATASSEAPRDQARDQVRNALEEVWRVVDGARELTEKLVVRAGPSGRSTARGLPSHFVEPSHTALSNDPNLRDFPQWRDIPLSPLATSLSIGCRRSTSSEAGSPEWELSLACAAARGEPDIAGRGVLKIENAASGEIELQVGLRECLKQPIYLSDGEWRLTLSLDDRLWKASIDLREDG